MKFEKSYANVFLLIKTTWFFKIKENRYRMNIKNKMQVFFNIKNKYLFTIKIKTIDNAIKFSYLFIF